MIARCVWGWIEGERKERREEEMISSGRRSVDEEEMR